MYVQLLNPCQIAQEWIEYFESIQSTAISFAIPGGRSPGKVLKPFAQKCPASLLKKLQLFWVDERGVPLGHPDRNDQSTLNDWMEGGALPAGIHPMPAEMDDLKLACQNYNAVLSRFGFSTGVHLSLLGIGEDGHFASCFPSHAGLKEQSNVFYLIDSPKAPPRRLSFSLPYILKSQRIDVLVMGEAKGKIIELARQQGPQAQYPISLLMDHPNIYFHLDKEALSALT